MLKNQKIDITKYLLEQEGMSTDDSFVKKYLPAFWQNPRLKKTGGLKLTEAGFEIMSKHFKSHQVRFEDAPNNLKLTNQLILRLDNFIDCPWFINHRAVWVFSDKMAVQLVLFSGNIAKFTSAKARSLDTSHK